MEPFALKSQRKPRALWIAAAAVAVVFSVWYFDLFPRIGPVETGSLPHQIADSNAAAISAFEGTQSWDEIIDRGRENSDAPAAESPHDDPVLSALSSEPEPLNVSLSEPEGTSPSATASAADRLRRPGAGPVQPASFEIESDVPQGDLPPARVIPAELAQGCGEIDQLYRDDMILEAHAELSQIYWRQPEHRALIRARIEHTASLIYTSPDRQFDEPYLVQPGDTLSGIAAKYNVTWQYLAGLNRTSAERLQAGQQLKVLKGPFSAVVDLDDFALTVHAHSWFVHRYRIGTGKDHRTPKGEFMIEEKLQDPTWYNPDGGQIGPEDPENPLGHYWLGLGNHIGIHGTNNPESIGQAMSRGCIHLADRDIDEVYHLLGVGSKVLIRQ